MKTVLKVREIHDLSLQQISVFFPGNCKNSRGDRLCERYKGIGYCRKYVSWMSRICKKSCNKCPNGKFSQAILEIFRIMKYEYP